MTLIASDVTVAYPNAPVPAVEGVDLDVRVGEMLALVGPNGSGKTTLARALIGALPLRRGTVTLDEQPIGSWSAAERARRIGMLAQREDLPFSWGVEEVVSFGRYPWHGPFAPLGTHDQAVMKRAMARADVNDLRHRRADTLSGGEWQRVRLARALAQEPQILVLDEPTAALDLGHEMEIFELLRDLAADGLTVIVVTHQLNLAARFARRMLLLNRGRLAAIGSPEEVLTPGLLTDVFGWPVEVERLDDGAPQVVAQRRPGRRDGTLPPPVTT